MIDEYVRTEIQEYSFFHFIVNCNLTKNFQFLVHFWLLTFNASEGLQLFLGGYHHPPKRSPIEKNILDLTYWTLLCKRVLKLFELEIKFGGSTFTSPHPSRGGADIISCCVNLFLIVLNTSVLLNSKYKIFNSSLSLSLAAWCTQFLCYKYRIQF